MCSCPPSPPPPVLPCLPSRPLSTAKRTVYLETAGNGVQLKHTTIFRVEQISFKTNAQLTEFALHFGMKTIKDKKIAAREYVLAEGPVGTAWTPAKLRYTRRLCRLEVRLSVIKVQEANCRAMHHGPYSQGTVVDLPKRPAYLT